jgi:hypothetical protein
VISTVVAARTVTPEPRTVAPSMVAWMVRPIRDCVTDMATARFTLAPVPAETAMANPPASALMTDSSVAATVTLPVAVTELDRIVAVVLPPIRLPEPEPAPVKLKLGPVLALREPAMPNVSTSILAFEIAETATWPGVVKVPTLAMVAETVLVISLTAAAAPTVMEAPPLVRCESVAAMPPASAITVDSSSAVIRTVSVAVPARVTVVKPLRRASMALRMVLPEPAPAPPKLMPGPLPALELAEPPPAKVRASMTDVDLAETPRVVAASEPVPSTTARVSFSMSLEATAMPKAAAGGPRAATIATPPASERIVEVSVAVTFSAPPGVSTAPDSVASTSARMVLPAPLPAPANEAPPPVPVATVAAMPRASAEMCAPPIPVTVMPPPEVTDPPDAPASVVLVIWLTATAAPTVPLVALGVVPRATRSAIAPALAVIVLVSVAAVSTRLPAPDRIVEFLNVAATVPPIVFTVTTPAPAKRKVCGWPLDSWPVAATPTEKIVPVAVAVSTTAPVVAVTLASSIDARASWVTWLIATEKPMASDWPDGGAVADGVTIASAIAPTPDLMTLVSVAVRVMSPVVAVTVVPVIVAETSLSMLLRASVNAPAPWP